ncbi:zinc-binding dehydrogenase [Actinokineospora globicatena]|uniref:zinc-binding dehydrogenase n=1 Tax=Actinokineospora globicatena TaxID=103729 RepID=UPI0020A2D389|nr:zinc-binding dehydrogenase [Actinokineospora globicatena]MCP2304451.1 S-(hydroxymethyl)glutathione dehydrogenase / alcohol dehydrogenase [Actinokineospora globicatena]GLW78183.1 alcohol dehydrogenase [Actinokineospora globicatena]GLW85151.1 alcohol dehydrogenase [Actinokineospora globicatena]
MVRAAVLRAQGEPLVVMDIVVPEPGPGQVRVRVVAAGVCHSDLSLANGTLRQPVPAVLGHEGAGVVVSVGAGVTRVAAGDHVLLNWAPPCRECWFCLEGEPYLCARAADAAEVPHATLPDGTPLYPGLGTGAFAEETIVSERAAVKIPADVPLEQAAVLGCAVLTGAGAVFNTAQVKPGQSVVVVGVGGVGLSVLQAARIAGAAPIIAVDVHPEKEALARAHGATHFLLSDSPVAKTIRGLTDGRGADIAFECVGIPESIRTAWASSRRGGHVVVVGVGSAKAVVEFSALELYFFGRTLTGCLFGSTDPDIDIPRLLDLVADGSLDIAGLVTAEVGLDGIENAFADMRAGRGGRTLVWF